MPKPKGGRGHAAPYDTKLMRVPVPLSDQAQQLIERYQDFIAGGGEAYAPPPLLDAIASDKVVNEFDEELQQRCMQLEGRLSSQEIEINSLHEKNCALQAENEQLRLQVENLEGENNFQQNRWELTKRHNDGLAGECRDLKQQMQQLQDRVHQLEDEHKAKLTDLKLVNNLRLSKSELLDLTGQEELQPALDLYEGKRIVISPNCNDTYRNQPGVITGFTSTSVKVRLDNGMEEDFSNVSIYESINDTSHSKAVNNLQPLSQRQLGKRLGISHTAIGKKQKLTIFTDWTRERDPEGIAWEYDEQSKLFQPTKGRKQESI